MKKGTASIAVFVGALFSFVPSGQAADSAAEILAATDTHGGLIVHIGCGGGELTAELRADGSIPPPRCTRVWSSSVRPTAG